VPELDPEFAKDEGFDDLDALRAKVRESLEARARSEANARARQGLLELIVERNPVELPESLVAREIRNVEHEIASAFESSGMSHDEAIAKARENADDLRKRAEQRARSALIVDAIAAQENLATTDDEVADRIAQIVTYSGRARDRMAEHYSHEENRAGLKQVMTREKTLDQLLTRAQGDAANAPVIVPAESGDPSDSGTPPVDA